MSVNGAVGQADEFGITEVLVRITREGKEENTTIRTCGSAVEDLRDVQKSGGQVRFASAYVVSFGLLLVCAFGLFVSSGSPTVTRPKTGNEDSAHRPAISPRQQEEEVELFAVSKDGKCGYIDNTGKIVIPLQFEHPCVDFDDEGIASVGLNGKWGFIDKTGRFVIEPKFDREGVFYEGFAAIRLDKTPGYVDKSGKITLFPGYFIVYPFSEGMAAIEKWEWQNYTERKEFMGYVDRTLTVVIPLKFKYASHFSDGLAYVTEFDESSHYIDRSGAKVDLPPSGRWFLFVDGLATTEKNGKEGYMDKSGRIVIAPRFDEARRFSHGLAAVRLKDKWGYIDRTGSMIIPPQFEEVEEFDENGIAAAVRRGRRGFIDRRGQVVVPFRYDYWSSFSGGLVRLQVDEKWGYVDPVGNIIWPVSK